MTTNSYDVIVLGTGGVGSAAALHLARRGARVLGIDRFAGAHAHGSSHGETRIIRKAYFEHPDYVPLLNRAYELWSELEETAGEQLYHPVGLIECGPPDGILVKGVLEAARQHKLQVETVAPEEFDNRFPFSLKDGDAAVYEQDAGYLLVERCVSAHLVLAARAGVELVTGESVTSWRAAPHEVVVQTDKSTYRAARLVITAGGWAGGLLADLGIDLKIRRKHLHWYACADRRFRADNGCPGFFFETRAGLFYGFPQIADLGVKVSEHSGGINVLDPLRDDKSVDPRDRERVEAFLGARLPGVSRTATQHVVCYYTMTRDEHFVVDRHPEHANVSFAAGLSGHGFKFVTALGEVLADLTLDGVARLPIEFLSCGRPGIAAG